MTKGHEYEPAKTFKGIDYRGREIIFVPADPRSNEDLTIEQQLSAAVTFETEAQSLTGDAGIAMKAHSNVLFNAALRQEQREMQL